MTFVGAGVAQSVWRLGWGLDDRGSIPGRDNDGILFCSPSRPDWLCSPTTLLSNGNRLFFSRR